MKRNAYTINHLTATVTVTKSFLKEAGIIGSPAYSEMLRLRRELPEYEITVHEAKKRTSDKPYGNLTYKKMEGYIAAKEGNNNLQYGSANAQMMKERDGKKAVNGIR